MLRINPIFNTLQAINYYANHLPSDDYYAKDQVIEPEWEGELSKTLGLNGKISIEDYKAIMNNLNPISGDTLTQVNYENRRAGYDLTFSVPKSVSLEFALNDNPAVLDIFKSAVKKTMLEIEKESMTRVRVDGQNFDRVTGNILYAPYFHQFARPDENGIPDPHLHCHVVLANVTFDSVENKMKAIQLGEIKSNGAYFQQVFNNYLADGLIKNGFEIRKTGFNFELEKYSLEVLNKFSTRTKQIEEIKKEFGITNAKTADKLGAKTRKAKSQKFTVTELKEKYLERLNALEIPGITQTRTPVKPNILSINEKLIQAKASVDFAIKKEFERSSTVSYKKIMTIAMRDSLEYGINPKWLDDEFKSLQSTGQLIPKEGAIHKLPSTMNYTTKAVREEEFSIYKTLETTKGKFIPISPNYQPIKDPAGFELSLEQKDAVKGILQSADQIMVFTGKAGTGKTTTLKEIERGAFESQKQVFIFAPTTGAVDTLQKDGFTGAGTIQGFLANLSVQNKTKDQIIMIDEAGLVSIPQMKQIIDTAVKQNARLILVGDSAQHTSVERGDALRAIESRASTCVNIYSIRRQIGQYKEATQEIAIGNIKTGYDKLEKLGYIKQDRNQQRLHSKAAKDYVQTSGKGLSVGLYVPTHTEGRAVTNLIRKELIKNGTITGTPKTHTILRDLNLELAVKERFDLYTPGSNIVFNQNTGEFKKGDIAEVKIDKRRDPLQALYLVKENGTQHAIPLNEAKSFSVMEKEEIQISKGDKIVTTNIIKYWDENGNASKLPNGKKLVIDRIDEQGNLFVKEDKKENPFKGIKAETYFISKNEKRINYGYYSTSHRGQGDTVDKAIIVATSKSLPAVNDKQFYVSTTRGRRFISIYTDNKEELSKHIQKSGQRELAIEPTKVKSNSMRQSKTVPQVNKPVQPNKSITIGI